MGPGYFVIAILGCADGGTQCAPVATMPAHYASESECAANTGAALIDNSKLDFPTLLAECRAGKAPRASENRRVKAVPASGRRG